MPLVGLQYAIVVFLDRTDTYYEMTNDSFMKVKSIAEYSPFMLEIHIHI